MTADPQAAQRFYRDLFGWRAAPAELAANYTVFSVDERALCGVMAPPPEIPRGTNAFTSHWSGYLLVEDVDETARRITEAGGTIFRGPWEIAKIGRMLVAADPLGARFIVMHPFSEESGGSPERSPDPSGKKGAGEVGWHELHVADRERAFAFYSTLFGWTKGEAMDIGEAGIYQLFQIDGVDVGGMMNTPCKPEDGAPQGYWLYYFTVESIDGAVKRVKRNGGAVLNGPMKVPNGNWVALCRDPQGAHFSLISPG